MNSADLISVNIDELRSIASTIKTKNEELYNLYKTEFINILEESKSYIKVSGLDFSAMESSFKTLFTNLNTQMNELSDVITNSVIPNYEFGADAVVKMFNSEFASQMQELLSIVNTK
jgi:hypothetical protein